MEGVGQPAAPLLVRRTMGGMVNSFDFEHSEEGQGIVVN